MYYGACYYPEHWTPAQAKDHIANMKRARIKVVRMGEFAWCKFEPEPERYEFAWMDEVVAALHAEGISTVMCTPTCIPPMWAMAGNPDLLMHDHNGLPMNPGARCHCCKNAPQYLNLCGRIVEAMAEHYDGMDGVIGWQTDNEFGCHNSTRCWCPHCEAAFRDWLREKYGSIDAVNETWGTSFWGFDFRDWDEVPLPKRMPTGNNPGHWLDFLRFSSDTQVWFQRRQYETLKRICPNHFVTHNFMGRFDQIDYYKLAEFTDFPCWDNYPDPHADPLTVSYAHDITRSFKGRFWVLEQKSGPTGDAVAATLGEQPERGDIRRWAWQTFANGADGLVYFRWRVCLTGAEQYWHGILDHDGIPRRRFREVRRVGDELHDVRVRLESTCIEPKAAIIRDFDTLWSCQRQPEAPGFNYDDHCFEWYRAVRRTGHSCDIVNVDADFSKYSVVMAPCLSLVDDDTVTRLETYAKAGGTLILTSRSGTRTKGNAMSHATRPGKLVSLVSATVEEVRPYHRGQTESIRFTRGGLIAEKCDVGMYVEILKCISAESVAEYTEDPFKGTAAITRNAFRNGQVYYVGVYPPRDVLERFVAGLLPAFPIRGIPEDVEVVMRVAREAGEGASRLFAVINHSAERQPLTLPGKLTDLLSGERVGPSLKLSGRGVLLLTE